MGLKLKYRPINGVKMALRSRPQAKPAAGAHQRSLSPLPLPRRAALSEPPATAAPRRAPDRISRSQERHFHYGPQTEIPAPKWPQNGIDEAGRKSPPAPPATGKPAAGPPQALTSDL
jgi:hypothetical protein